MADACGGNEALRQEVASLLASIERAKSFLETPAVAQVEDAFAAKNLEGQQIGSYHIETWRPRPETCCSSGWIARMR